MNGHSTRILRSLGILATAAVMLAACRKTDPGTFASPQEAATALGELVGSGDTKRAEEIFGPGSLDLFQTGDPAEDQLEAQRVKEMITRYRNGDLDGARALDEELRPAIEILRVQSNPIAIKKALELLGHEVGGLRLPLVEADDEETTAIRDCLGRLGLLAAVA